MTVAELTQDVQYTVDTRGQVTAVVVEPALWQRILAALEDGEVRALVQQLQQRLSTGPHAAGALAWEEIAHELQHE